MDQPTPLSESHGAEISYRHVTFVDAVRDRRRPVNFSPPELRREARLVSSLSSEDLALVRWLFEAAGLQLRWYRQETLARRMPACYRFLRVHSAAAARKAIEQNPSLIAPTISSLIIGVTSFFRDPGVFHALKTSILPTLFDHHRPLRIWSVGCSDGQEMYSITMLLAELGWLNRADLLGTDCRSTAIRHAADGIYGEADIRSVPDELFHRYFIKHEESWRIISPLRTVVQWRTADALQIPEPGAWDMILCRNFAMYLEPAAAADLWEQLVRALRPGRYLVAGKAERPGISGLRPVQPCVFRKI